MREVVTLQVGGYANFIGAHFWNFQAELLGLDPASEEGRLAADIDSDVLHRVGETAEGIPTYTPRLLVYDVKGHSVRVLRLAGSLGSVRAQGTLYADRSATDFATIATWSGQSAVYRTEPIPTNEFLRSLEEDEAVTSTSGRGSIGHENVASNGHALAARPPAASSGGGSSSDRNRVQGLNGVKYWTDYLIAHLHPKSVVELRAGWEERDGEFGGPFRSWGEGLQLLGGEEEAEERLDRLRWFVEGCDHLQGFQCAVDTLGGFAPLGSALLQEISDEYPRVPRVVFGARATLQQLLPGGRPQPLAYHLTDVLATSVLSSLADVYLPVGRDSLAGVLPHVYPDDRQAYHTSAVYAAALETLTLPYRLRLQPAASSNASSMGALDMAGWVRQLASSPSAVVAATAVSLPAQAMPGAPRPSESVSLTEGAKWQGGTTGRMAESLVWRGSQQRGGTPPYALMQEAKEALRRNLRPEHWGICVRHTTLCQLPILVPLPFPPIFDECVGRRGELIDHLHTSGVFRKSGVDVEVVPSLSRTSSGLPALGLVQAALEKLQSYGLRRRGSAGTALLAEWGLAMEEAQELAEQLQKQISGVLGIQDDDGDYGD